MTRGEAAAEHGLLRSAGVVSAAVLLSRLTGLVREAAMARLFGAGAVYDAFLTGFRIPNLMRNLFAEGALSSAFVPTFTESLTTGTALEAAELAQVVATALTLAAGAICLLGMIFSPQLVRLLAPGFARVPGKFELTVLLTRVMFPFLLLVALAAEAMAILNARGRFGVPALASMFFNIGSVASGLALGLTVGRRWPQGMIVSMAAGVLIGGALQLGWQLPSLRRAGISFRPRIDFGHPGLRRIARLMLPALIGSAAVQIKAIVNANLASGLTDAAGHALNGPVSWLAYAFRFLQFPLGLFGAALASATLPAISRSAALGRLDEFRATLAGSLRMALLLTIPSSVGLAVLGESMIGVVYQGGRFGAYDTHQTALALACYSVGLAGYAALKLLAPAFYALDDAWTPMAVSVASIGLNLLLAIGLARGARMGQAGLALATSLVALAGAAALAAALRRRIESIEGPRLAVSAAKIALAAAAMGAVCRVSSLAIHGAIAGDRLAHLADLAVSIPLGVGVFYALARALGIAELRTLEAACYTAISHARRSKAGDPPARD
ncbi:MAG: murein biosynthesis integral membrane protein MurJ [Bryobacteraceae bacterium]|jgi:putative peptidoglycan lipid II flippase